MKKAIAILFVLLGCCTNVIFLEFIIREEPGSGNIITFFQFLFIALEGFVFTTKFGSKPPSIPMRHYVFMVSMFFIIQVVNNYSLNFSIPMPLHMIFRSGSLIANLILGVLINKKTYKLSKYISVILITVGISICTLASANVKKVESSDDLPTDTNFISKSFRMPIGISMLIFALFLTAYMGIYQENTYKKHGKHPAEALFYNHFLPLPAFLFISTDIYNHIIKFSVSESLILPFVSFSLPRLWVYLIFNMLTQYICIRSVFVLTTECASLTVTLVVTIRKFLSLIFSIFYFQNPFTLSHWIGSILGFGGTLIFTETLQTIYSWFYSKRVKSEKSTQ